MFSHRVLATTIGLALALLPSPSLAGEQGAEDAAVEIVRALGECLGKAWSGDPESLVRGNELSEKLASFGLHDLETTRKEHALLPIQNRLLAISMDQLRSPALYAALEAPFRVIDRLADTDAGRGADLTKVDQQVLGLVTGGLRALSCAPNLNLSQRDRFKQALHDIERLRPQNARREGGSPQLGPPRVSRWQELEHSAFRLVWERALLMPPSKTRDDLVVRARVSLAAHALKRIGDPRSILVLEQAYLWSLPRRDALLTRSPMVEALVTMGETEATRRKALAAAWRCYAATKDAREKGLRYRQASGGFDASIAKKELADIERLQGYVEFLRSLLGRKAPSRPVTPEEAATGDTLLATAIAEMFCPTVRRVGSVAVAIKRTAVQMQRTVRQAERLGSGIVEIALIFPAMKTMRPECTSLLRPPLYARDSFRSRFEEEVLSREAAPGGQQQVYRFDVDGLRVTVAPRSQMLEKTGLRGYIVVARRATGSPTD